MDNDFTKGVHGFKNGAPAHARNDFLEVQLFLDTWGFLPNDYTTLKKLSKKQLISLCNLSLSSVCRIDISGEGIKFIQKLMHEFKISPDTLK